MENLNQIYPYWDPDMLVLSMLGVLRPHQVIHPSVTVEVQQLPVLTDDGLSHQIATPPITPKPPAREFSWKTREQRRILLDQCGVVVRGGKYEAIRGVVADLVSGCGGHSGCHSYKRNRRRRSGYLFITVGKLSSAHRWGGTHPPGGVGPP